MSSSMKAAVHLGPNCLVNLEVYKNMNFEEIESFFNITQKLMPEHSDWIWNRLRVHLDHGRVQCCFMIKRSSGQMQKVRVFSDSVLCVGQINESKEAITRREGQMEEFKMYPSYKELLRIVGEAIGFEWNIFRGFSSLQILQEIQRDFIRKSIEPEEFTDQIMFMSMFKWQRLDKEGKMVRFASFEDTGRFWVLDRERSGMGNPRTLPMENRTPQPIKRYSDWKKPVISCSEAPVLWVVEFWERRRKPYTSLEIHRIVCTTSQWKPEKNRRHFRMKMWEIVKLQSWSLQVEGFRGHVAADVSLLGKSGKWWACGWAVVQLDYDEEMGAIVWDVWFNGGRTWDSAHHQEGRANGISMPSQESDRTHQGACGQHRNNWWITKQERTRWQRSGMKSKSWNKEGWEETLGSLRLCEEAPVLVVQWRMSQGKRV